MSPLARLLEGGVKPGMAVEGAEKWIQVDGSMEGLMGKLQAEARNAFPYCNARTWAELRAEYSVPAQLCRLFLGKHPGLKLAGGGHLAESSTNFGHRV